MNEAILKTVTLILLIAIGAVMKRKFGSKDKVNGIKEIVLSIALPSTIFIALLKINLDTSLFFIPLLALAFNFILYLASPLILSVFGIEKESSTARTLTLLLPSLAPGLSCFPFIMEFLGEESLAFAAMGDIGNKIFVLIFLYIIAMNMSIKNSNGEKQAMGEKIISLLKSLISEPINILMVAGIILLSFGIQYDTLPAIVRDVFDKTSALMTPLVLIFIGLAVNVKEGNKRLVLSLLSVRAGISLILSAILIAISGITTPSYILLSIVFSLSCISFWPFAHMSLFEAKEVKDGVPVEKRTFNIDLAIIVLAISLPFSTTLILTILTAGTYFVDIWRVVFLGLGLIGLGSIPMLLSKLSFKVRMSENHV
jgi:malate permease and related proteins